MEDEKLDIRWKQRRILFSRAYVLLAQAIEIKEAFRGGRGRIYPVF